MFRKSAQIVLIHTLAESGAGHPENLSSLDLFAPCILECSGDEGTLGVFQNIDTVSLT